MNHAQLLTPLIAKMGGHTPGPVPAQRGIYLAAFHL